MDYHEESRRARDITISRPLLARLMAAIETPGDLTEEDVTDLLMEAALIYVNAA